MRDWAYCDCWGENLAAKHSNDLVPSDRLTLQKHSNECPSCAAAYAAFGAMEAHIRALPQSGPLSSLLHQLQRLQQEQEIDLTNVPVQQGISTETCHRDEPPLAQLPTLLTRTYCITISIRCMDTYREAILDESNNNNVALIVEDLISLVLTEFFHAVNIEEVAVHCAYDPELDESVWAIRMTALGSICSYSHRIELEGLEFVVEDKVCCTLVELFGLVVADVIDIVMRNDNLLE
jgi:hypothetical protein